MLKSLRDSWKISASLREARPGFAQDISVSCRPCPAAVSYLKTRAGAVTETLLNFKTTEDGQSPDSG